MEMLFIKKTLNQIRMPNNSLSMKYRIRNTLLIFLLGILLGVFSKWLDNLSINDAIWWQYIIGLMDLRNVFSLLGIWIFIAVTISVFSKTALRASLNVFVFFIGMNVSYHLYTIYFSGFNPMSYMMIWYAITLVTPLLAYVCWYAKSDHIISVMISGLILCVMFIVSFSIGMWYFDINSLIDFILFIATVIVLHVRLQNTFYSLMIGLVLAFIMGCI